MAAAMMMLCAGVLLVLCSWAWGRLERWEGRKKQGQPKRP